MSEAIFPSSLPGIKWDRVRQASFKTSVYEALSGAERRISHRPTPKRRIELAYEVLREQGSFTELQTLASFFEARLGAGDSFLFHDPYDGYAINVLFGVGNGSQTDFQLVRPFGSTSSVVHNPEAGLAIGRTWFPSLGDAIAFWPLFSPWPVADELDGSAAAALGITLLPNGIVRFGAPPPAGKKLLWTGRYFHRARFADDVFDSTEFLHRLFSLRRLALVMSLQNIL